MTTSEHTTREAADSDAEQGERQAMELADRIRMVAAQDPELAQDLVDQLIVALDKATGGTFREHLDDAARAVAERGLVTSGQPGLVTSGNQAGTGVSVPRNS